MWLFVPQRYIFEYIHKLWLNFTCSHINDSRHSGFGNYQPSNSGNFHCYFFREWINFSTDMAIISCYSSSRSFTAYQTKLCVFNNSHPTDTNSLTSCHKINFPQPFISNLTFDNSGNPFISTFQSTSMGLQTFTPVLFKL